LPPGFVSKPRPLIVMRSPAEARGGATSRTNGRRPSSRLIGLEDSVPTCTTTAADCPGVTVMAGSLKRTEAGWDSRISAVCPDTRIARDLPASPFPFATISSPGIPTSGESDVTLGAAETLKKSAFDFNPPTSTATLTSPGAAAAASGIVTVTCPSAAETIVPVAAPNRTATIALSDPNPDPESATTCPASALGGAIEVRTGGGLWSARYPRSVPMPSVAATPPMISARGTAVALLRAARFGLGTGPDGGGGGTDGASRGRSLAIDGMSELYSGLRAPGVAAAAVGAAGTGVAIAGEGSMSGSAAASGITSTIASGIASTIAAGSSRISGSSAKAGSVTAAPSGIRTASFAVCFEPGGPRKTRSPSWRGWSAAIFSPFTYVPVAVPTSDSKSPRASQTREAWFASTFPSSSRRVDSGDEPSVFGAPASTASRCPSNVPPETVRVGTFTSAAGESVTKNPWGEALSVLVFYLGNSGGFNHIEANAVNDRRVSRLRALTCSSSGC